MASRISERVAAEGRVRWAGRMRGLRITSVAIGVLVDKLAALLLIGALLALLGVASQAFQLMALAAGFGCTTLGAFVAGRHANRRMLAHGVAVGLVGLAISVTRFLLTPGGSAAAHSVAWEVTGWFCVVVAGIAGGYLASRGAGVPP